MNIYIVGFFFFLCFFFLFVERFKSDRITPWLIIPFYLFIVAYSYTPDTEAYESFYYSIDTNIDNIEGTEFAEGFQVFTKIVKTLVGDNFNYYMLLYNLVNLLIILFSIKLIKKRILVDDVYRENSEYFDLNISKSNQSYSTLLVIVMYFAYFGLFYNSIAIRANITLSLLLLITAILYLNINKVLKIILSLILFTTAVSFHSTAIIGVIVLLIYFFTNKLSTRTYLVIWIVVGLFYFSGLSEFLVSKFLNLDIINRILSASENQGLKDIDRYRDIVDISNKVSFRYIYLFVMGFYFFNFNTSDVVYYKYLNIYFTGLILGAFFGSMETFGRVLDYFSFYFFILAWIRVEASPSVRSYIVACFLLILPQLIFVLRIINDVT